MTPMPTSRAATRTANERRTRLRLRDLCDEVLASHRVANDRDLFDDADRAAGRALLTQLTANR